MIKHAKELLEIYNASSIDEEYWGRKAYEMTRALEEAALQGHNELISDFKISAKEYHYLREGFKKFGYTFEKNDIGNYILSFPIS